jgi:hypothetical protein
MLRRTLQALLLSSALLAAGCGSGVEGPTPSASEVVASAELGPPPDTVLMIGGSDGAEIRDLAVDGEGNVYAVGGTRSTDFPSPDSHGGDSDIFVVKWSAAGERQWARLIGGAGHDRAYAVQLDPEGNVVIGGRAAFGLPVTPDVFQPAFRGGDPDGHYGSQDGFVAKLDPSGELLWASYLGGPDNNPVRDVAVDGTGTITAYVKSDGHDLHGALQAAFGDAPPPSGEPVALVVRIAPTGRTLPWARWIGGARDIYGEGSVVSMPDGRTAVLTVVEGEGAMVTEDALSPGPLGGFDWHVSLWGPDGALRWATYFGGSANDHSETHHLGLDADGNVLIASGTESTDIPGTERSLGPSHHGNGGRGSGYRTNYSGDILLARLSADGATLLGAAYLGGSAGDAAEGLGVAPNGALCFGGGTFSPDFPARGAFARRTDNPYDGFVAGVSADLTEILFASVLGTPGGAILRAATVAPNGDCWVGGSVREAERWAFTPPGTVPAKSSAILVRIARERWNPQAR